MKHLADLYEGILDDELDVTQDDLVGPLIKEFIRDMKEKSWQTCLEEAKVQFKDWIVKPNHIVYNINNGKNILMFVPFNVRVDNSIIHVFKNGPSLYGNKVVFNNPRGGRRPWLVNTLTRFPEVKNRTPKTTSLVLALPENCSDDITDGCVELKWMIHH